MAAQIFSALVFANAQILQFIIFIKLQCAIIKIRLIKNHKIMGCVGSQDEEKRAKKNSRKKTTSDLILPNSKEYDENGRIDQFNIDPKTKQINHRVKKEAKEKGKQVNSNIEQSGKGLLDGVLQVDEDDENLSEVLGDEQDDIFKSQRATSRIYKHSKIMKKESSNKSNKQIHNKIVETNKKLKGFDIDLELGTEVKNQILEGVISEEVGYSKIIIYSSNSALEFTIPKTRAGPIVVPYMNYQKYMEDIS